MWTRVALAWAVAAAACSGTTSTQRRSSTAEGAAETASSEVPSHLRDAVAHPARPPEDRARDEDRKPARMLAFFGIEPGMKVAEMMAGRGYYAEILARAVGSEGTVYVHNTPYVLDKFAREPLIERLDKPGLGNVIRKDRSLEDPGLPEGELDAVLMILFYHDTYWMDVNRDAMNAAIYKALKPGGVFGVVDHHARPGAGTDAVKSLHRIEPQIVKQEILEAGFELDAQSDRLRHPEDDRASNVFDEAIRGKTDRFAFRFRKPE